MDGELLKSTYSVCTVCMRRIPAMYVCREDNVYLEKECPEHGRFAIVAWRGGPSFSKWAASSAANADGNPDCPELCGLCEKHANSTCCAILDLTSRCNLSCRFCFADCSGQADQPLQDVFVSLEDMYCKGIRFIHLSGGEPTVRDDLATIVEYAFKRGYEYIQLNTNGLRLAEAPEYLKELRNAGLSSVFLQFDGTDDSVYHALRGRAMLDIKNRAIENCGTAGIGVVLVPTVVPGINDRDLGGIVKFALKNAPAVRGVHFQPVAYMGTYPGNDRRHITIPEVLRGMEEQTGGLVRVEQFSPSSCDSPLCGFHAEFRTDGGALTPMFSSSDSDSGCCCSAPDVRRNQSFVKNRWTRMEQGDFTPGSMDAFLKEQSDKAFSISGMAFQDSDTLDIGRVMQCSVHVYRKGKLIPFCVHHNS